MEIRIWIPESWSALRYMIRHPKSWIIGAYGFERWQEEHQRFMSEQSKRRKLEDKIKLQGKKLAEVSKELSVYKRADKETGELLKHIRKLEIELYEAQQFHLDDD